MNRRAHTTPAAAMPRAFTLLELLVVIGIITIVASLIIFAAPTIFSSQQAAQTRGVLNTLERALDEYRLAQNRFPLYDEDRVNRYEQIFNAANLDPGPILNYPAGGDRQAARADAFMFVFQTRGFGNVDDLLAAAPPEVTRTTLVNVNGEDIAVRQFVDAWDNPILFVHQNNELAQDLFGRSEAGRPYFMSAGPDEVYGLASDVPGFGAGAVPAQLYDQAVAGLEDNLFSSQPGPRRESEVASIRRSN